METKKSKLDLNGFKQRGKWNQEAIKEYLKEQFAPETQLDLNLMDFYKQFYGGTKTIKYVGYYCRKHVLDAMHEIKIKGIATVQGQVFKIGFLPKK